MKRVLIIEDSLYQAEVLAMGISELGCKTVIAPNGKEALEKLSGDVDLVILDTVLPDTNGFRLCKKIKELKRRGLVVIMTTGKIDSVDVVKARKAGADDYAVKTQDFKHLVGVVKKYL